MAISISRKQLIELESSNIGKRAMEKECEKMRRIINVYIQSEELNNPVWEIMHEDDLHSSDRRHHHHEEDVGDGASHHSSNQTDRSRNGFHRNDAIDASKLQLRTMNRLDIEMNEVLTNVLKEENRQRLLMTELMKLLEKNKDYFNGETAANKSKGQSSSSSMQSSIQSPAPSSLLMYQNPTQKRVNLWDAVVFVDAGVQVDGRDEFGVVEDENELEALTSHIKSKTLDNLGPAPLPPLNLKIVGGTYPYQLRACMKSFSSVLRVPPAAWACQVIMAIYLDKLQSDPEMVGKGFRKQPMSLYVHHYFETTLGSVSAADVQVSLLLKACEYHMRSQPRVALFTSQLGLLDPEKPPPMDVRDTDFILQILHSLMYQGELMTLHDGTSHTRGAVQSNAATNKHQKLIAKPNATVRTDIHRSSGMNTIRYLFDRWLPDNGDEYVMKINAMPQAERGPKYIDVDSFISLLIEPWTHARSIWEENARYLFHEYAAVHRVLQEAQFANDEGQHASDTILVEVDKQSALDCIRRPIRAFHRARQTELEFELGTNKHDVGKTNPGKKTVAKASSTTKSKLGVDGNSDFNEDIIDGGAGNINKEPVCEVMDRKSFMSSVAIIDPTISSREMESMFDEACDIAHENVLRSLETFWIKCVDDTLSQEVALMANNVKSREGSRGGGGRRRSIFASGVGVMHKNEGMKRSTNDVPKVGGGREYFVNLKTSHSQWTKPYYTRTFRSQDIDIDAFVSVLIRRNVLSNSPIVEQISSIPPVDLWSNADMFQKQAKENRINAAAASSEQRYLQFHSASSDADMLFSHTASPTMTPHHHHHQEMRNVRNSS